jgi:hypothetical protein
MTGMLNVHITDGMVKRQIANMRKQAAEDYRVFIRMVDGLL